MANMQPVGTVIPMRLAPRRFTLDCGWRAVRIRDNRRAPRYKAGEYVIFNERGRISGRCVADEIETLPEVLRQLEARK